MRRGALLFGLLLAFSPRSAPAGPAPSGREVLRLLDATRMVEADAMLQRLPPSDAFGGLARALLLFHRGDYRAAGAAMPAPGTPEESTIPWLRARIEAAGEATADHFERAEQNFIYRFAPGADAILVDYAIEALEGQRAAMARVLGNAPERPVVVEFFPNVADFVKASGLPPEWVETTNTIAICKWDRMLVLSPMNFPRGFPWKDTLAHEYVHLVLSRASHNQAPVWFQEGSAKVMESWWRRGRVPGPFALDPYSETLLAAGRAKGKLIPFKSMHPSMAALPSAEDASLAFAEVATAIDFVLGEVGEAGYRRIVEQTALHGDVMRAMDEVMGLVGGAFETRWGRWLAAKALVARTNIASIDEGIEAGAAGRTGVDSAALDPILVGHRRMLELVRVADQLRTRGHGEAALIEYQRAAASEPFHSPSLANKQARVLLALGREQFARDVLEDSVALYPEFTPTVALLAQLARGQGDLVRAETWAMQAIGLNPFDPGPHEVLRSVYESTARPALVARESTVLNVLKTYAGW